jgi:hypothetical protein
LKLKAGPLGDLEHSRIPMFNPRGRALKDIPEVRILLGLISLCIDPSCALLDGLATFIQTKHEIKLKAIP